MSRYLSAILAGIVLCASAAWSETVELPLTDDAYINGIKPDVKSGTWANIVVHRYGPKYGLVRFDAASIAGQYVSEATLKLYLNDIKRNGTISVHAITSGWNEDTVTWNNQPPAETTATAILGLTTGDVGGVIAIDVTAAVQRWADGSLPDAGFMIITSEGIRTVYDAEEMIAGTPPTLEVTTRPVGPLPGAIEIQAHIDGRDHLLVKGDTMQWHHLDYAAVGREAGSNSPTLIGGLISSSYTLKSWLPDWPELPPANIRFEAYSSVLHGVQPPIPTDGVPWQVEKIFGRGRVDIVEQPNAANGFTLVLEFDDNRFGGSAFYGVVLSKVPADARSEIELGR